MRMANAAAMMSVICWSGAVVAQETITLSLSTFLPPQNVMSLEFERWAEEVAELSDGRLEIEIFPAGQMGPPAAQYDIARSGAADLAYHLHGLTPGRFPLTELSYLPGMINGAEQGSIALAELTPDYLAAEHKGVKLLYIVAAAPIRVLTGDARIDTIEDMRGLRLRHPSSVIGGSLSAVGAVPVAVPPPEMGDALARGIIDGVATSIEAAQSFRFIEHIAYANDINIGTGTFAMVMNQASYDGLPPALQAVIDRTTGLAAARRGGRIYDAAEARVWDEVRDSIERVDLSDAESARFDAVFSDYAQTVIAEHETKSLPARQVFDHLLKSANR
ncbi:MAG: TRAP transporter substrate-binding protein [Pseudomonadota bacterium]